MNQTSPGLEAAHSQDLLERVRAAMRESSQEGWTGDAAAVDPDRAADVAMTFLGRITPQAVETILGAKLDAGRDPTDGYGNAIWGIPEAAEAICALATSGVGSDPTGRGPNPTSPEKEG